MTVTTEKLEASKKLARDYIDQVFNQHNPAKAADFVTGDVVWHGGALGDITGAENLAGLLGSFIGALPDLRAAEPGVKGWWHRAGAETRASTICSSCRIGESQPGTRFGLRSR